MELISELRSLLGGAREETWPKLLRFVDALPAGEALELALDYLNEHLQHWSISDRNLLYYPEPVAIEPIATVARPSWPLVRSLSIDSSMEPILAHPEAFSHIDEFVLWNAPFSDLDGWDNFPNIVSIKITGGRGNIENIDGLEALPQLQSLSIRNCVNIKDYTVIERLPQLRTLQITDSYINDTPRPIQPLNLQHIRKLETNDLEYGSWIRFDTLLQLEVLGLIYQMDELFEDYESEGMEDEVNPLWDYLGQFWGLPRLKEFHIWLETPSYRQLVEQNTPSHIKVVFC